MDTLDATIWDVVIAGTGLHESLLALALSRTGKRVLHVDKNDYYGGTEAAMSLQEFTHWAEKTLINDDTGSLFSSVSVTSANSEHSTSTLSFSRAYNLALAPQLLYARSSLLSALVSSRVESQLEFLAMGSWWTYIDGSLKKVPSGREELFASQEMTASAKRSVMKFLRFVADPDAQQEVLPAAGQMPFSNFLESQFGMASATQQQIYALVMSPLPPHQIQTSFAVMRIAMHLRSIGVFGPGFGAVIPKWGGLAEIAQVGCRAGAVGGGVYVLGNGISELSVLSDASSGQEGPALNITLMNGEKIKSTWLAGSVDNIPHSGIPLRSPTSSSLVDTARSITIVSSPLRSLFTNPAEGAPPPAGAVVVFPPTSLASCEDSKLNHNAPVYIIVHTSDTGECPTNQCVLYASTAISSSAGLTLLDHAVEKLLQRVSLPSEEASRPQILWRARYLQRATPSLQTNGTTPEVVRSDRVLVLPSLSTDLVLGNEALEAVEQVWRNIVGDGDDFLHFAPRNEELDND